MERRDPLALSAMRRLTSHPVVQIACAAAFTTATLAAALWCTEGHDPGFWIAPGLSTLVVSFVGLVLCVGLWITAVALRWIGASTGYGFCFAAFGLFCSVKARAWTYFIFPPVGYGWRDRAPFPRLFRRTGRSSFGSTEMGASSSSASEWGWSCSRASGGAHAVATARSGSRSAHEASRRRRTGRPSRHDGVPG